MDERWKELPRERLQDSLSARKRHLPQMQEEIGRIEASIAWWRQHSLDGPLEGDEAAVEMYRNLIKQAQSRIAVMEAFLRA
jgi:hypothetical protein